MTKINLFVVSTSKQYLIGLSQLPVKFNLIFDSGEGFEGITSTIKEEIHGILVFSDVPFLIENQLFEKVRSYFSRVPLVWVSDDKSDFIPNLNKEKPLFCLNIDEVTSVDVQIVMANLPQFKKMIYDHNSLIEEVESTQMIADLNIDRLHRTLQDLEKAKVESEKADKVKQRFLASVTHELRTPLTAIIGFADLFETNGLTDEQLNSVSIIREASQTLLHTVNDVLNFSKLEEGKLEVNEEAFNLKVAVEEVYVLLQDKALSKNLSLDLEYSSELHEIYKGDKFRIGQVLTNLINNAIKFTEKGGVSVIVEPFRDTHIKFVVRDTGIGIQGSKINQIFDSFSQAEEDTTARFGGTGLGLSIVKELISLMGGEITVKSIVNKGSDFVFQLPLQKTERLETKFEGMQLPEPDLSDISVLVVEDNYLNQMLIQKLLNPKVKQLIVAGDGESAVNECQEQVYDVILMDLQLPKINGLEAIELIQSKGENKHTPIAVITANIWEEQLNLIKSKGVNTLISKPFNKVELYQKIFELASSNIEGNYLSLEYIKEVSGGDVSFMIEMLRTFNLNINIDLNRIQDTMELKDQINVKAIAHKMKSSFRMFELKDASDICDKIELDYLSLKELKKAVEILEKETKKATSACIAEIASLKKSL